MRIKLNIWGEDSLHIEMDATKEQLDFLDILIDRLKKNAEDLWIPTMDYKIIKEDDK